MVNIENNNMNNFCLIACYLVKVVPLYKKKLDIKYGKK